MRCMQDWCDFVCGPKVLACQGFARVINAGFCIDCVRAFDFDCSKGFPKSVQVLFDGIEAVMVLTLIILK